jgi:hypothetical protein
MKAKNMRMLQTIALAAGLAAGASVASAAGQVGQRHLKATLDGVFWDTDSGLEDGIGGTLTFNQPLAPNFDLGLGFSHLKSELPDIEDGEEEEEIDGGSISSDAFSFNGTWFAPAANGKLYVRGAVAWTDLDVDITIGDDSEWLWALETGLEIALGQRTAITPFISYTDGFDNDIEGVFDFGVMADFDVSQSVGIVIAASINDDSDVGLNGGVLFRF